MTRAGLVLRGAVLALACAAGLLAALAAREVPDRDGDVPGAFSGAILPSGVLAPAATLHDERGRPVRLSAFGAPAVVAFATAACEDVCALTTQTIRGALDRVGTEVPAVLVAVDPPRDTAARARRFLLDQRATGRIRFALGSPRQLAPVWRAFAVQPETVTRHHQARIVLLDARGRQRVGYFTSWATPEAIAHDLRALLDEAARAT